MVKGGKLFLQGRIEKKLFELKPPRPSTCSRGVHKRLSCQSCHSTWVPQCFGCHVRADYGKDQLDKLTLKETPGLWQEFRSFIRFESPCLGVMDPREGKEKGHGSSVVILVPG